MKFNERFYDKKLASGLVRAIEKKAGGKKFVFMEVCGTHTVSMFRSGIRSILPPSVKMISGPGCPVCVTADRDIDYMLAIARLRDTTILTFGDMMKVPSVDSSLEKEKAEGCDIRVVYSPLEILDVCRQNPGRNVVFFSIGFETTTPTIAAALKKAKQEKIRNLFVYPVNKLIPPAMKALLEMGEVRVDGFMCPGHVSTIIGADAYNPIAAGYNVPCVITGFEPLDILQGIYMLTEQASGMKNKKGKAGVSVQYKRCVDGKGNTEAQRIMSEVFSVADANWRGIGVIPGSGQKLSDKYADFDAAVKFRIKLPEQKIKKGCRCGEILRGLIDPGECPMFGKACTPENPYGPCMVSVEGTCAAHYKYSGQ